MVILGNKDRVLPQEAFERVADLVPPETSEVINVGVSAHMVMLERRDAVNRAIERFIERNDVPEHAPRWRTDEADGRGNLLRERPWLAHHIAHVAHADARLLMHLPRDRFLDRLAWLSVPIERISRPRAPRLPASAAPRERAATAAP